MTTNNITIDDIMRISTSGSIKSAMGNLFYGLNHLNQPSAVPINRDLHGYTFFVRPQLNLSDGNLRADRTFGPLLTTETASVQRIIRNYLDPRYGHNNKGMVSPFVDNSMAFIPLLTNHLESVTGWPDPTVDMYTSKRGAYKEEFGHVDGVTDKYSSYSLTTTFRNMSANPILKMMAMWQYYSSCVFTGSMSPYPDYIINNTIDYNTRIYRLVLDHNKRYVTHIACTGASILESVPLGTMFNYDAAEPYNHSNKSISIQWKNYGYCYDDDILITEFNATVGIFNIHMTDDNVKNTMTQIPNSMLKYFNYKGYPRINPRTYELEWWMDTANYKTTLSKLQSVDTILNPVYQNNGVYTGNSYGAVQLNNTVNGDDLGNPNVDTSVSNITDNNSISTDSDLSSIITDVVDSLPESFNYEF